MPNNELELEDYPKLECPFVRETFEICKDDLNENGRAANIRHKRVYLVTPKIRPGYEWVFEDTDTIAIEKLDGTNVKVRTEDGYIRQIQNRKNIIHLLKIKPYHPYIMEGIHNAIRKGYVQDDGVVAGELVGPKLQGNPYLLDRHIWHPFGESERQLSYHSFRKHEITYENLRAWFRDSLRSRFYMKAHKVDYEESVFAEGVIFYNRARKAQSKVYRAKLRRDMFDWYYSDAVEVA